MSSNSASSENINSEKPSSDEPKNNDAVPLAAQDEGVLEAYLDVLLKDDVTQPSLDVDALPQRASEGERPASSLVFSFSYGCSLTDPARGDDRRQTALDADRKMYDYKLTQGTDGMPTVYVGYIINRSAAEVTDLATGLGNFRGLMSALGETRTKGCSRNRMPARLQAQPA